MQIGSEVVEGLVGGVGGVGGAGKVDRREGHRFN